MKKILNKYYIHNSNIKKKSKNYSITFLKLIYIKILLYKIIIIYLKSTSVQWNH